MRTRPRDVRYFYGPVSLRLKLATLGGILVARCGYRLKDTTVDGAAVPVPNWHNDAENRRKLRGLTGPQEFRPDTGGSR